MMQSRQTLAFVFTFTALTGLGPTPAGARNVRECQSLSQRYEQIKAAAGTIERNSLLFSAAQHDCLPLAKDLLKDGASLEARDRLGNMPLAKAAKGGHVEMVKLFLKHKAPINARNLEASTPLFLAIEEERREVAEILLAAGADPNMTGRTGLPPIAAAAYTGNPALVALMLKAGADPRATDADGKSAMIYAAGRCYTTVVKQLLDQGIDINQRLGHDLTVLMWAAGHSDDAGAADVKETVELLISRGAQLDSVDDRGRTALMIAAELGHTIALETLLKAGADRAIKDKSGKTAADLATDETTRTALASR